MTHIANANPITEQLLSDQIDILSAQIVNLSLEWKRTSDRADELNLRILNLKDMMKDLQNYQSRCYPSAVGLGRLP